LKQLTLGYGYNGELIAGDKEDGLVGFVLPPQPGFDIRVDGSGFDPGLPQEAAA